MSIAEAQEASGLTQAEIQALFRLVIRRAVPTEADAVNESEGALCLAANILKSHGFDASAVLTVMAQMWSRIEGDDVRAFVFNVVDHRYVGWNYRGRAVLIDMATGGEISPDRPLPRVGESTAYNPYVLLARRVQEGRDANCHTPRSAAAEGVNSLGEPQVLRDDTGTIVP